MISNTFALVICFIAAANAAKLPAVPGFAEHGPLGLLNYPAYPITPYFPFPGHPGFLAVPMPDKDLHCFSCNENYAACRYPFLDLDALKGNYVPCNGQCVKFRNPNDNFLWYRGCSNERFSNAGYQPPVVVKDNIVYYFCDVNGCNIF